MHLEPIFTEGMSILAKIARKIRIVFADYGLPPMADLLLRFQEPPKPAQLVECSSSTVFAADPTESKQPCTGCPLGLRTHVDARVSVVDVPDNLVKHMHPAIQALVVAHRANGDEQPPEKKQCLQSGSSGECAVREVRERRVVCTIKRQGGTYTFGLFDAPWEPNGPNSFHNTQNGIIAHVVLYDGEYPLYVVFVLSETCVVIGFSAHFSELKWVDENVAQQIAKQELEASGMDAKTALECVRSMPQRALTDAVSLAMSSASDTTERPFSELVKMLSGT